MQIKNEYKETWIEFPEEAVSYLIDLDSQNMKDFSTIGQIISVLIDEGEFKDGDKKVKINEDELLDILEKNESGTLGLGGCEVDFRVDLSSASNPSVFLGVNTKNEIDSDSDSEYKPTTTSKASSTTMITFSNINNTVISFNESNVKYDGDTFEDPDDLFLIAEKG